MRRAFNSGDPPGILLDTFNFSYPSPVEVCCFNVSYYMHLEAMVFLREPTLSYKERMHPKVSKAEIDLFKALSVQGLTGGMVTQQPIILKSTIPDFCWMEKRKIVYLDGNPVHKKDKQLEHDEEIDDLLTKQGWEVLRIKYDPPLTEKGLSKIMAQVKEFLNVDEEPIECESVPFP